MASTSSGESGDRDQLKMTDMSCISSKRYHRRYCKDDYQGSSTCICSGKRGISGINSTTGATICHGVKEAHSTKVTTFIQWKIKSKMFYKQ